MTYSRKVSCILELNIANLTPKHSLTNAILQFLLSNILSHAKRHPKKKKKYKLNSSKVLKQCHLANILF